MEMKVIKDQKLLLNNKKQKKKNLKRKAPNRKKILLPSKSFLMLKPLIPSKRKSRENFSIMLLLKVIIKTDVLLKSTEPLKK